MSHEHFEIPANAPIIGGIYYHYSDPTLSYQVDHIYLNDRDEFDVVYRPLYKDAVAPGFTKSVSNWTKPAVVAGKEVERYVFVRMV
jgi:hypothetical protein